MPLPPAASAPVVLAPIAVPAAAAPVSTVQAAVQAPGTGMVQNGINHDGPVDSADDDVDVDDDDDEPPPLVARQSTRTIIMHE